MKKHISIFLIAILAGNVTACCTKKDCEGADEIFEIQFYNFSQTDLDTIKVISFSKNQNFSVIIDSSVTQASDRGGYFSAYTVNRINTNLDYKIELPGTGLVYTLMGFETEKEGCNSCFPYRPKSDLYNKLNSYRLNGVKQTGNQIKIYK